MNDSDRQIFWKTLCSLEGQDMQKDCEVLSKTIKVPKYLYRYRPVSLKSIEALRYNRMYFSTANYYDDPFDTFIHVDIKEMENFFSKIANDKIEFQKAETLIRNLFNIMQIPIIETEITESFSALEKMLKKGEVSVFYANYFRNIRNEIKKDTWSVCFSENGFNETLWLKYAEQHKGFVLIYDMENAENFLCGQQEKCSECGIVQCGTPLYPIYYSNEKYDATRFAQYIAIHKLSEGARNIGERLTSTFGNQAWERERIMLIKKECHKYDEEWRMVVPGNMRGKVMREWIPTGVILGLRMENDERDFITDTAKQAGIKNIYQSFINDDGELYAYLLK